MEEIYIGAFWDLSTHRSSDGMTVGRIPWLIARTYGREELGFHGVAFQTFWIVISKLDAAFLNWQKNEHDRYRRQASPAKSTDKKPTKDRAYQR